MKRQNRHKECQNGLMERQNGHMERQIGHIVRQNGHNSETLYAAFTPFTVIIVSHNEINNYNSLCVVLLTQHYHQGLKFYWTVGQLSQKGRHFVQKNHIVLSCSFLLPHNDFTSIVVILQQYLQSHNDLERKN